MPIQIRESADPLSQRAREDGPGKAVVMLQSEAGRILEFELTRYCRGEIQGRSFLISGHRGAGKTTMVADAIGRVASALSGGKDGAMRPLPVFLHGPNLFDETACEDGGALPVRKDSSANLGEPINAAERSRLEEQAKRALVQIILALHRAVAKEFATEYRERLLEKAWTLAPVNAGELAAQFEVELLEDPPASRLLELYAYGQIGDNGVLFRVPRSFDQTARELVALNGICNAHQRISGALSAKDKEQSQDKLSRRARSGTKMNLGKLLKPIAAVFAGSAVGGGVAAGSGHAGQGALFGLLAAIAASTFLGRSSTSSAKRERQIDRVFIPDLSLRTLDRLVPVLLDRLRMAGLNPVLVVDELDKVDGLSRRIVAMIHCLKKLLAENVFTCFLTDRGYMEYLRIQGRKKAYDRAYSYFSHSLLIAYQPDDLAAYLKSLLEVKTTSNPASKGTSVSMVQGKDEEVDLEVLKWVLRHRSQLHALNLNREIATLRGENGIVRILPGAVRSPVYRVDVTLQVIIELQLNKPHVIGWRMQNPQMLQILVDAVYYLTRSWLSGARQIEVPLENEALREDLESRMNLQEVTGVGESSWQTMEPLNTDDMRMLSALVQDMALLLSDQRTLQNLRDAWRELTTPVPGMPPIVMPPESVMDAVLTEGKSLLVKDTHGAADSYIWRYWRSGTERGQQEIMALTPEELKRRRDDCMESAKTNIAFIEAVEARLWPFFRRDAQQKLVTGVVYPMLASGLRVLRTTPAWSEVQRAIQNVQLLEQELGNSSELEANANTLFEFASMVSSSAANMRAVLVNAAFLAGLSDSPSLEGSVAPMLEILCNGLHFEELDPVALNAVVTSFQGAMEAAFSCHLDPSSVPGAAVDLEKDDLLSALNASFVEGQRKAPQAALGDWSDRAWRALQLRLLNFVQTGQDRAAEPSEILAAALRVGPTLAVPLNLKSVTLYGWTTALLASLSPPSTELPIAVVPVWLAAFCLGQLGIGNAAATGLEGLIKFLTTASNETGPGHEVVATLLSQERLWQLNQTSPPTFNRTVILVRKSRASIVSHWNVRPKNGVLLIIEASQAELKHFAALCSVLPGPLGVAYEQLPDSAADEKSMQERLKKSLPVFQSLWVYPQAMSGMKLPHVVNPTTPEGLLDDKAWPVPAASAAA